MQKLKPHPGLLKQTLLWLKMSQGFLYIPAGQVLLYSSSSES